MPDDKKVQSPEWSEILAPQVPQIFENVDGNFDESIDRAFEDFDLDDVQLLRGRTEEAVNLVKEGEEKLFEILPEPTEDSEIAEKKISDFVSRAEKLAVELRELEKRTDDMFGALAKIQEQESAGSIEEAVLNYVEENVPPAQTEEDGLDFDIDVVEEQSTGKDLDVQMINPEKASEAEMKMEEKRKELAKLKNKNNEFSLKKFFFQKSQSEIAEKIAAAEREYETARAEFVGANVMRALDEQMNLVDQMIWEKTKSADKLGKAWGKIRMIYKKLGDLNLEKFMKKAPDSWLGKFGARMVSARTAINAALLGAGALTGGAAAAIFEAPRAAMRFVGTSGLTYDALQNAARAKEEKSGFLQDMTEAQIMALPRSDIMKRMQTVEARAVLDGVKLSESRYSDLYLRLQNALEKKINEDVEQAGMDRYKAIEDFFAVANNELDAKIDDLQSEKIRHKAIAGAAGAVSAAGWIGRAVNRAIEATGGAELLKNAIGYVKEETSEFDLPVKEKVSEWPLESRADVAAEEISAITLTPEQVVEKIGPAVVGEKEGLTFPIFRDIAAHPEHLENYAKDIKGIDKMIERHGGDVAALSEKEQRLASWLIYKHDFGHTGTKVYDVMEIRKPGSVAVVFDEGRYKLGSVDDSPVENNLYIKSAEKIPLAEENTPEVKAPEENIAKEVVLKRNVEAEIKSLPAEFKFESTADMLKSAGMVEEVKLEVPADKTVAAAQPETAPEKLICSPEETIPILAAEGRYEKVWEEVKNKLAKNLHTEKTVPFALPNSGGQSKEFILRVIQKIGDTAYLDLTNKNLVSLLDHEPETSSEAVYKAVEDEVFGVLPKEADVLLDSGGSGGEVVVLEGGSNAIKFIDPGTGKGFFAYDPEYVFYQNNLGDLLAKKAGVEYVVEPAFENGELRVDFKEIK